MKKKLQEGLEYTSNIKVKDAFNSKEKASKIIGVKQINIVTGEEIRIKFDNKKTSEIEIQNKLKEGKMNISKELESLKEFPEISKQGNKLLANGTSLKDWKADDVSENLCIYLEKQGNLMFSKGTFYAWFLDSKENAEKFSKGEIGYLFFPPPIKYNFRAAPISNLWKKKAQGEGTEHILAVCKGYLDEELIYIDKLSVRPGYKKNSIATKILDILRKDYPDKKVEISGVTKEGSKFLSKYSNTPENKLVKDGARDEEGKEKYNSFDKDMKFQESTNKVSKMNKRIILEQLQEQILTCKDCMYNKDNTIKKLSNWSEKNGISYGQLKEAVESCFHKGSCLDPNNKFDQVKEANELECNALVYEDEGEHDSSDDSTEGSSELITENSMENNFEENENNFLFEEDNTNELDEDYILDEMKRKYGYGDIGNRLQEFYESDFYSGTKNEEEVISEFRNFMQEEGSISNSFEDDDYEEETFNREQGLIGQDSDDTWIDPAGGTHYGDEEDPAKMYESKRSKYLKIIKESVKTGKELLKKGLITEEQLAKLIEIDPSKTKKYVGWMCKQLIENPNLHVEDMRNKIEEFDLMVTRNRVPPEFRDITKFKTFTEFEEKIDELNSRKSASLKELERDYELIADTPGIFIGIPHSHESSRKLGMSKLKFRNNYTDCAWCTTYGSDSHFMGYYYDRNITFYYVKLMDPALIEKLGEYFGTKETTGSDGVVHPAWERYAYLALVVESSGSISIYDGYDHCLNSSETKFLIGLIEKYCSSHGIELAPEEKPVPKVKKK